MIRLWLGLCERFSQVMKDLTTAMHNCRSLVSLSLVIDQPIVLIYDLRWPVNWKISLRMLWEPCLSVVMAKLHNLTGHGGRIWSYLFLSGVPVLCLSTFSLTLKPGIKCLCIEWCEDAHYRYSTSKGRAFQNTRRIKKKVVFLKNVKCEIAFATCSFV